MGCSGPFAVGERVDVDAALADAERRFEGFDHPCAFCPGEAEPILDHFERWAILRVYPGVALALEELPYLAFRKIRGHGDRESDDQSRVARTARPPGQVGVDGIGRVARDGAATAAAAEPRGASVEELKMVVQLRHGPHGGTRGAHRVG